MYDTGGALANRITVAGGNFDSTVFGATGGLQNHTLTQAELPAVTPAGSGSSTFAATRVTSAPRATAARARA